MSLQTHPPPLLVPLTESPHIVGAPGEPAFNAPWTQMDVGVNPRLARFWRTPDGIVHLAGCVKNGNSGTTAFTLPPAYAPAFQSSDVTYAVYAGTVSGYVQIGPTGIVIVGGVGTSSPMAYCFLDGVSFQGTPPVNQTVYDPSAVTFYGTTPPVNPTEGMTWVFPADAAKGIIWRFRYRAGQTLPWEFVGGAELVDYINAEETASGTWIDLPTPGPSITLPRTGDYDVLWGYYVHNAGALGSSANSLISRSVDAAGTQAQPPVGYPNNPQLRIDPANGTFVTASAKATVGRNNAGGQLVAGDILRIRYFCNIAAITIGARWMRVKPVRVS